MLELFIIFAFSNDETDAAERIELVPGGANGVARKSILESMGGFKLEDVHCFDPNEEIDQAAIGGGGGGGGGRFSKSISIFELPFPPLVLDSELFKEPVLES